MRKSQKWVVIAILAVSFLSGLSIAFRSQTAIIRFFSIDDAFYYFKVAQNFTEGKGLSFDGIARGNGFHPLWMMICIPVFALARFDLWLPLRLLVILQALIHAATGYFIYRLLVKKVSQPLAIVTMVIWLFSQTIFNNSGSQGLETGINVFCIAIFFYYLSTWTHLRKEEITRNKILITSGLAALVLLARLDNIYLVTFIGAWVALKDSRLNRRWIFLDFFLIMVSVILSNYLYVGLTSNYYHMIPQIRVIAISSLAMFPLGQFLVGIYNQKNKVSARKDLLLQSLIGTGIGMVFEVLLIIILFGQTGYSRVALAIQILVFAGSTAAVKILFSAVEGYTLNGENKLISWRPNFRAVFNLDWKVLIQTGTSYFGPLFSVLGGFLVFNHFYFGTSMPLSGKIKAWWGTHATAYGYPAQSLSVYLGFGEKGPWYLLAHQIRKITDQIHVDRLSADSLFLALVVVIVLGLVAYYFITKALRENIAFYSYTPIALGLLIHVGCYTMTGYVGYRRWYWISEYFFLLILGVLFLDILLKNLGKKILALKNEWVGWCLAGITSLFMIVSFLVFNWTNFPAWPDEEISYLHNAQALETSTEPGSIIGMTGGGWVAYFIKDRTIINMDGLINGVDYYKYLTEMRLDEYLDQVGTDYIFGKGYMLLHSEPYMVPLTGRLELLDPSGVKFIDSFNLFKYISEQ